VLPEQSSLGFAYHRQDAWHEGRFTRFSGEGRLDPDAPDQASLELRIETDSIDLGNALANGLATSAEWFDSANYPVAVFRLTRLVPEAEGDDRYRAEGELTIRGKTLSVETTLTIRFDADHAHASGTIRLDRTRYGVGVGPISLIVAIGDEVAVDIDLVAGRAP